MVFVLFLTGIPIAIMIIPVFQIFTRYDWLSLGPTGVFLGVTPLPFELWMIKISSTHRRPDHVVVMAPAHVPALPPAGRPPD
jgi:ABC-type glycerol-3-phosphate transport system permease component